MTKIPPQQLTDASLPLTMWSGGQFFAIYPEKVLGHPMTVSGRFGDVVVIDGTIDNLSMIDLPEPTRYEYVLDAPTPKSTPVINIAKVKSALKKTKASPTITRETPVEMISFGELTARYNSQISDEEMAVWVWYQKGRIYDSIRVASQSNGWSKYIDQVNDDNLQTYVDAGLMCYDGIEYLPAVIYYAGNIYQKISEAKQMRDQIVGQIGEAAYNAQMAQLEATLPTKLRLDAPANERLFISLVDDFVTTINVSRLSDGTILEDNLDLRRAFYVWADQLPDEAFTNGSSIHDIQYYYVGTNTFTRGLTDEEKADRKRAAQADGQMLFQKFLSEGITREDQQIVEHIWNTTYNSHAEYNFEKIPVGFEINKYFKTGLIDPRKALWDGVRFMGANGSGIIAFDVGVGKTMTAILAVGQAMYTGQCKRPLIVVPNPTYAKWISETVGEFDADGKCVVHGVLPQYANRVNDYYNLGVGYMDRLTTNPVEDYSITFVTYEGFERLGLSRKESDRIGNEIYHILNQGDMNDRGKSQLREKVDEMLGTASSEVIAHVDELGFDYIVIDEAHNCKKIFTKVKNTKGEKNHYQIEGGVPSSRGLKAFIVCQYILRHNAMRNVCLLTATPFTNSPLEIYSMLSLVAYQHLEKRGMTSLTDFFDKFINETTEEGVNAAGKIVPINVVKNYNNKILLQTIIFSSILYKTGAEAGVKRPVKVVYPLLKDEKGNFLPSNQQVETYLPPTDTQKYWLKEISKLANGEANEIEPLLSSRYYDERDQLQGRVLLGINMAQNITLSPYLFTLEGPGGTKITPAVDGEPDHTSYIHTSPKLTYVMECVRSVRNYHMSNNEPISGQVIYMNRGIDYFELIKTYLVEEIGYASNEVKIIGKGIDAKVKERIKQDFLSGKVKIIIGSSTIKEGIDLQNNSTVLYNVNLDWNPTDIQQLEGRIWRQGNKFSHVRIVTPLLENSIDVFLFQKLEEKTNRINDIWSRNGRSNVLDVDSFDPRELKLGLMTDPEQRAIAEVRNEITTLERNAKLVKGYIDQLGSVEKTKRDKSNYNDILTENTKEAQAYYTSFLADLNESLYTAKESEAAKILEKKERVKQLLNFETEKQAIALVKKYAKYKISQNNSYYGSSRYYDMISNADALIRATKALENLERSILTRRGMTVESDLQPLLDEYEKEFEDKREEYNKLKSDEYLQSKIALYRDQMAAAMANSKGVEVRVKQFEKHNHLLSCIDALHACDLEGKKDKAPGASDDGQSLEKLQQQKNELLDVAEELSRKHQKRFNNPDISTPKSQEEKDSEAAMNAAWSKVSAVVHQIAKLKKESGPTTTSPDSTNKIKILKLKAKAIKIKLQLLAA